MLIVINPYLLEDMAANERQIICYNSSCSVISPQISKLLWLE